MLSFRPECMTSFRQAVCATSKPSGQMAGCRDGRMAVRQERPARTISHHVVRISRRQSNLPDRCRDGFPSVRLSFLHARRLDFFVSRIHAFCLAGTLRDRIKSGRPGSADTQGRCPALQDSLNSSFPQVRLSVRHSCRTERKQGIFPTVSMSVFHAFMTCGRSDIRL